MVYIVNKSVKYHVSTFLIFERSLKRKPNAVVIHNSGEFLPQIFESEQSEPPAWPLNSYYMSLNRVW